MWRVWKTSCLLLLVVLCLIGLELRDSRLVIPSLGSLVLFSLVFNFLFFSFLFFPLFFFVHFASFVLFFMRHFCIK